MVHPCPSSLWLSDAGRPWAGCNFIPEDLHPKSFRGSIGHNTNVWAVRDRAGMPVGGPTGVFAMEQVRAATYARSWDRRTAQMI